MSAGRCLLTTDPRLAFTNAWLLTRHYAGDFRTIPTNSTALGRVVVGVEESEARFIDDACLFYANSIHESIEKAAANYGLMVESGFHSHAEFCQHDGEIVCHLASWSMAFGRN